MPRRKQDRTRVQSLGAKLKKARRLKDWTQEVAAGYIGVHPQTLSNYERGNIEPSLETVSSIAELYGVSMESLYIDNVQYPTREEHSGPTTRINDIEVLYTTNRQYVTTRNWDKFTDIEIEYIKAVIEIAEGASEQRAAESGI